MIIKDKRILVTGGTGVIGQELLNLIKQDNKVFVADLVQMPEKSKNISFKTINLARDNLEFIKDFDPNIIFHLAAVFERSVESGGFWNNNFENNVMLSHKLIDISMSCQSLEKFVFASSYLVYDKSQYMFSNYMAEPIKLKETDKMGSRNLCGVSKYYTEKELEYIQNSQNVSFTSVSARIYRVYGKGSHDVISRWIRAGLRGETIELWGGENSFDFVYSRDVAKGLLKITENNTPRIVNLGGGISRTIKDVLSLLESKIQNLQIIRTEYNGPYEKSSANIDILKKYTCWKPEIRLEDGISEIIEWEQNRV